ncbi:phage tail protein [Trinickia sp. EG282A]|uniref:phage tail protein n=1 Tax=Trinickia sp. EG282A TaxID=3237013 RepID=UPI0034D2D6D4
MSDPYVGEIRMVAFNFAPQGWALCQGQLLAVAQNEALYSLLGTFYGGNGVSNFQLPDLRGRTPVGAGQGLGLSSINLGEQAGTENVQLTISNMPSHTHSATAQPGTATGSVALPATTSTASENESGVPGPNAVLGPVSSSGRPLGLYSTATDNVTTLKPFNVSLQTSAPAITNSPTGSNTPVPVRNPYLGINFCIALQGVFPPRG